MLFCAYNFMWRSFVSTPFQYICTLKGLSSISGGSIAQKRLNTFEPNCTRGLGLNQDTRGHGACIRPAKIANMLV